MAKLVQSFMPDKWQSQKKKDFSIFMMERPRYTLNYAAFKVILHHYMVVMNLEDSFISKIYV